MTIY